MDTLVGYVSFVFDAETIKLNITQRDRRNKFVYEDEEKVKLSHNSTSEPESMELRSIADHKLIDKLLYKKILVKVEKRDPFETLVGKVSVLG